MTTTNNPAAQPAGMEGAPELKPCPFCGSPTPQVRDTPEGVYLDCYRKGCGVEVLTDCETAEEARIRWNTRATPTDIAERALRAAERIDAILVRSSDYSNLPGIAALATIIMAEFGGGEGAGE